MATRTMGSRNQHRLTPLSHTHLVLLFLAYTDPSDHGEHELGSAHVCKHDYYLRPLLLREGKTCIHRTGPADEERSVEARG
jgi:hypothetical protein